MAVEVVIPRLGWTMEEGTLVEWMKQDGDTVAVGDVLFTVESDKSLNEVESFESGILRIPPDSPPPGTALPVGAMIAYLVQPGEAAPFEEGGLGSAPGGAKGATDRSSAPGDSESTAGQAQASDDSRTGGNAATTDAGERAVPSISPRARRTAAELGVEWEEVAGSGRTGRIVERDIRAAAPRQAGAPRPQAAGATYAPGAQVEAVSEAQPSSTQTADRAQEHAEARAVKASPLARRLAKEAGIDLAALAAARPDAVIQRADVEEAVAARAAAAIPSRAQEAASLRATTAQPATAETRPADTTRAEPEVQAIKASPLAKRLAKEAGIDLAVLAAAKPGAVIQRADVEEAIASRQTKASQPAGESLRRVPEPVAASDQTRSPSARAKLSRAAETQAGVDLQAEVQTATATQPVALAATAAPDSTTVLTREGFSRSIAENAHATAPVTLITEADATELVMLRDKTGAALGRDGASAPTCDDLIIKLVAVALKDHPALNSSWQDGTVILHPEIHIGLAVETAAGPVSPVIRDASSRSLREIAALSSSLMEKAGDRLLTSDEVAGATFTVHNLGAYGVDAFTPIIGVPQCAILGVGRIARKPAVHEGQIVPRDLLTLSLTFDHRIVDGAPAARFLNTVREYVEQPFLWLSML